MILADVAGSNTPNISQQTRNFSELRHKLRGVPNAWSLQQPGGRVSDALLGTPSTSLTEHLTKI